MKVSTSNMSNFTTIVFFVLFTTTTLVNGWGSTPSDKVKLKDIEVLTLYNGQYTNGRRSPVVPQIQCVGGAVGCHKWTPDTVQCYNRGNDGADVQWECKSEMPIEYKFGAIAMSCEGYDYPHDSYVVRGSCGLEYKLEYSGKASTGSTYYQSPEPESQDSNKSSFGEFLICCGVILVIVAIFYFCINSNDYSAPPPNPNPTSPPPPRDSGRGQAPPAYGSWNQGNRAGAGQQPPPPGFRTDNYPDSRDSKTSGSGGGTTYNRNRNAGYGFTNTEGMGAGGGASATQGNNGNTGGGFWTGAATGGLLGYMMGRNAGESTTSQRTGYFDADSNHGSRSSPVFRSTPPTSSSSTSAQTHETSGETHTSSGFGGTKRR